jgi:hypothetical protein
MAENVYQVLKNENPALTLILDMNDNVSSYLMSLYAHVLQMAIDSPHDPKDLILSVDIIQGRLLRISPRYYGTDGNSGTAGIKSPVQRNMNLVRLFQVNRNVKSLAERLILILEKWVNDNPATKEQGFPNIKIINPLHRRDGTFTAELVVHFEFEDYVSAKMKWFNDMEEPEHEKSEGGLILP